uniref:guanylate cyclase n=1 Tax=Myripristis murdjan TaxID=586833 RepID=A0A667WMY9_9TELE
MRAHNSREKGRELPLNFPNSIKLDWTFKYSLMLDIVKGMDYLHRSPLHSHGHLSSSNCVVDSRFVLKVTDYGVSHLRRTPPNIETLDPSSEQWTTLLWRAPELLRNNMPPSGTQRGDVYSFGIIVQEVVYRCAFKYALLPPFTEIVERVKRGGSSPLRPHTDTSQCPESVETLMTSCWSERPADRPDFSSLRLTIKRLFPTGDNILDNLLSRLEQYATNLEEVVNERTAQCLEEKRDSQPSQPESHLCR